MTDYSDVWIELPGEELDHWPWKVVASGPGLSWQYWHGEDPSEDDDQKSAGQAEA